MSGPGPSDEAPADKVVGDNVPAQAQPPETADTFHLVIYRRMVIFMVVLAAAGLPVIAIKYGAGLALSFLAGTVIAIVNFHWLRRTIEALADRVGATGRGPSRSGVVFRFLLRYFLIALVGYVILNSSANNLYGLFAGLSLPVGAILMEAAYETYKALRTGS